MVLPAFVIDSNTGATISRFGIEVDVPPGHELPYVPERWALARRYTVPAPAGHSWGAWAGALVMLLTGFVVLLEAL